MFPTLPAGTELCGIILHPAGHTRSPALHKAAFQELGVQAEFHVFDVRPKDLAETLREAREANVRQLAVSLPHKISVMSYLDDIDQSARRIGAVNTITLRNGRLEGANTDWMGAVQAIERERSIADTKAVVLGAGGAARAVIYGLLKAGAEVTILNRTLEHAEELAEHFRGPAVGALSDLGDIPCDILVNTTAVGLQSEVSPVDAEHISPQTLVMDTVYDPEETKLLRDAQERGARTLSGRWMLVYQAMEQVRLWTGLTPSANILAEAFYPTDEI